MNQLQSAIGLSHGSVSGIKKRLIKKEQIKSTYAELHMADKRVPNQVETMLVRFGRKNPTLRLVITLMFAYHVHTRLQSETQKEVVVGTSYTDMNAEERKVR